MSNQYETRLECDHKQLWKSSTSAPQIGDRIYCVSCDDMKKVIAVPGSWLASCRACRWRRAAKKAETIHKHMLNHLESHPAHAVDFQNYDKSDCYVATLPRADQPLRTTGEMALWDSDGAIW
jgi:hypothetical protein